MPRKITSLSHSITWVNSQTGKRIKGLHILEFYTQDFFTHTKKHKNLR